MEELRSIGTRKAEELARIDRIELAAWEGYERSIKIREKAQGPDHPELVTSFSNLAAVYNDMGRSKEAEQAQQRADAISEKNPG